MYYIKITEKIDRLIERNNLDDEFVWDICTEFEKKGYKLKQGYYIAEQIDCYEEYDWVLQCLEAAGAKVVSIDELREILFSEFQEDEEEDENEEDDMSIDYKELWWDSWKW